MNFILTTRSFIKLIKYFNALVKQLKYFNALVKQLKYFHNNYKDNSQVIIANFLNFKL